MDRTHMRTSTATIDRLNQLVDGIEAKPGRFIDPNEMTEAGETIDVASVVGSLPDGLSELDFVEILKLAMLTECATESYATVFREGARLHDARWLARFTERTWVPDERTHATPYKAMLLSLGFGEAELDREISDVQGTRYEHGSGITPIELTTFGMVQEQLTDQWHGLIANLIKPTAPFAAHMANRVKGRETLHALWYREMTAIQVAGNPVLLGPVADTIMRFELPGTQLAPELQSKVLHWMPHLNVDFAQVARALVRNFSEVTGSTRGSGELLTNLAYQRGYSIGPFPVRMARAILNGLGGLGYEILGEAILERVGLPFESSKGPDEQGPGPFVRRLGRSMRGNLRQLVARRIDLRAVTGETAPAV
jgi:hypothetical protein